MTEPEEDLAEVLAEQVPDGELSPVSGERHTSDRMRRLVLEMKALQEKEDQYAEQLDQMNRWIEPIRMRHQTEIRRLSASLLAWHEGQIDEHGEGPRAIELVAGTLRAKAQVPEWSYDDPDAFEKWAREGKRFDLLTLPPPPGARPDARAVKAALADQLPEKPKVGDVVEVAPGLSVTFRPPKLTVEPNL